MPDIARPSHRRSRSLHDQLFKELIGTFLPDFVRLAAPEAASRLNFSVWKLLNKEAFTDWPKGRRRELDLLAEVALADGSGRTALIHVEIEARARPGIGDRLSSYYMQVRLRYGLPVISIVLCLRRGRPGIREETVVDANLGPETNRFRYYAFHLEGCRAEDFLAVDLSLAWALAALMDPGSMSRAEHKMACLRRIAGAGLDELQKILLANCVETYLELEGRDAEELERLAPGDAEEVRGMRLTWAEKMEAKGARQTLLRQLAVRFGPLTEEVKRRIEAISSIDRLGQMAEQILVARSLEEMGLR